MMQVHWSCLGNVLIALFKNTLILLDLRKWAGASGLLSVTTPDLNTCSSWLYEATWKVICRWVLVIMNASFREGVFPAPFKEALVCLLLKKLSLDPTVLDNFNPASHLSFLVKVIEKVVTLQVQMFLDKTDDVDHFYLCFRPRYGTEIALFALLDGKRGIGFMNPSWLLLTFL